MIIVKAVHLSVKLSEKYRNLVAETQGSCLPTCSVCN